MDRASRGARLALSLAAAGAALGAGEAGLRLLAPQATGPAWFDHDPELGAVPVPGQRGVRRGRDGHRFSFTHDPEGRRVVPGAAGLGSARCLLVVGDSFTYGQGVHDAKTWCSVMQEDLRRARPPTRVVNAGNPGKGTDYALKLLLARGRALAPERVLLAFFKNDFGDNERGAYFTVTADAIEERTSLDRGPLLARWPGYSWLLSRSHLANLLREAALRAGADRGRGGPAWSVDGDGGPRAPVYVTPARQELARRYLEALAGAAAALGAPLTVAYLPDRRDAWLARRGRPPSPDEAAFREIARSLDLDVLSLTPILAAADLPLERLYLGDGHWTPAAHTLAARALLDAVRREDPLPEGAEGQRGRGAPDTTPAPIRLAGSRRSPCARHGGSVPPPPRTSPARAAPSRSRS